MSADNRICIMYDAASMWWAVWNGSCSCEYHEPPSSAKHFPTEKEAVEYAHAEHDRIQMVEGGVQRISKDEQMTALMYHINDLSERLLRLRTEGRQYKSEHEDDDE
jgi:hypothetical protein